MKGAAVPVMAGALHIVSNGSSEDTPLHCGCNAAKIEAVHTYLNEYFPAHVLEDFHTTSRSMQMGRAPRYQSRHVIRITDAEGHCYHVIVLSDFLECSMDDVREWLRRWNLAATLRGHHIAVVAQDGVSAL